MQNRKTFTAKLKTLLLFIGLGLFLVFVARSIVQAIDYRNSDFFTFWLAGRLVWEGKNPYLAADWVGGHHQFGVTWIPNSQLVYPIPIAFFYAPLGFFPLYYAYILWIFFSELMILSSLYLLIQRLGDQYKNYIFPILVGVLLFRPTWLVIKNGQITSFLLFTLVITMLLWDQGLWFFGGMLLACIALKPNLGIPILVIMLWWLLLQRKHRAIQGVLVTGIALILLGQLLSPNWVIEYLTIGNKKAASVFGYNPTLWGIVSYLNNFGIQKWWIFGIVFSGGIFLGGLVFIGKKRTTLSILDVTSLAITITLFVTPYTWPYDQILLIIPIFDIIKSMKILKYPYLAIAAAFLSIDVLAVILLYISARMQREVWNAFIPFVVLGALLLAIWAVQKNDRPFHNAIV